MSSADGATTSDPGQAENPSPALQPNSQHCFACGLENPFGLQLRFYSLGPGRVEARVAIPQRFEGYPGVVHGGIVATMLDEIVGRLAMTDDPNHFLVTARLEIRYRMPVPVEQDLLLRGALEERRGRRYLGKAQLLLGEDEIAAEAEAILIDHPDAPSDSGLLRSLGWRLYPVPESPSTE